MTKLPLGFIDMLNGFGQAYAAPLVEALRAAEPSLSVRVNTLKGCDIPQNADSVPWCGAGVYLSHRPVFAADPAWHQGLYYVQDASSMAYSHAVRRITELFFKDKAALRYLDACAAPGGKTGTALEALPPDALVVANELDPRRAAVLLENMARLGAPNVAVTRGDAATLGAAGLSFDIIAVDAPCSGEGMMRKEAEAVAQWSPELVRSCAATQRDIVDGLWQALAPGGVLIYSTCTFNRSENEAVVEHLAGTLGGESIDLGLDKFAGVFGGFGTGLHCYRFAPGHVRGEGLFIAAVRKHAGEVHGAEKSGRAEKQGKNSRRAAAPSPDARVFADSHIRLPGDFTLSCDAEGTVLLQPAAHAAFISALGARTRMLRAGLPVARAKGRDLAPTHELALSTALDASSFPTLEFDRDAALAYLHGDSLTELPDGLPRGYVLATFDGRPLGFVKNIGRRANNLCPDAFRLRTDPSRLENPSANS